MKKCARCHKDKPDSDYVGRYSGKIRTYCEQCAEYTRKAMKAWRKRNPEKDRANHDEYVKNNREKLKAYDLSLREGNREKYRKASLEWAYNNSDKMCASSAKRRAAQTNSTPKWLTVKQLNQMQRLYSFVVDNPGYQVDHIVPLRGKNVCGLHVPWNLQILTAEENMRKGNRFNGD